MAESAEHAFLASAATAFLERASGTRLFSMQESDRKRFDFACLLQRDWSRPLVGQVLWKHQEGIEKDLRTLVFDQSAEIGVYLARDTPKHRTLIGEIVTDYRRSPAKPPVDHLRVVWVPGTLELDSDENRAMVARAIEDQLASDVLLNVVLGNPTPESIRHFTGSGGSIGLDLAVLWVVATEGFFSMKRLSLRLGKAKSTLGERLTRLVGCGFLRQPNPGALYFHASLRGRVFLELLALLGADDRGPEASRLLRLLDVIEPDELAHTSLGVSLLDRIAAANTDYEVRLGPVAYHRYWESQAWPPRTTRPSPWKDH